MNDYFVVDKEGMRELYGDRPPWQLVKELIVNVFDEYAREDVPEDRRPTFCRVTLDGSGTLAELAVEDDGPGFKNLRDAYTLFAPTPKRGQAQVAGRFNLGEKEVFSLCEWGRISTVSGTVVFSPEGRRVEQDKCSKRGTVVELSGLPWTEEQRNEVEQKLRYLIAPAGLRVTFNGKKLPHWPVPAYVIQAKGIETVLQSAPGEPMRTTWRNCQINVYHSDEGYLCELGCPIQPLEMPYIVDIRQKVPLPPTRDRVSQSYLKYILAEVLNAIAPDLKEDQAGEAWVKLALEAPTIKPETVQQMVKLRFGTDKVLLRSSNTLANERAMEAGYQIVPSRLLSEKEREALRGIGVVGAGEVFQLRWAPSDMVVPTTEMLAAASYAKLLARMLCGVTIGVEFYSLRKGYAAAEMRHDSVLAFNVGALPDSFFRLPLHSDVTEIILHELAHIGVRDDDLMHGANFDHSLAKLSAKLAHIDCAKLEQLKRAQEGK